MTVGIVLGAGGPLGWAYHLGVVEGVRDAIGSEPADAERIVGTSAGAAIAAGLVAGASTDDVLGLISNPPSDEDREQMRAVAVDALRHPIRNLRPVAPGLIRRLGHVDPTTVLFGLLPAGLFPTIPLRKFGNDDSWPAPLWVPTVRLSDGEVVVLGRDSVGASVSDAIEASSAMPALFTPKQIGEEKYVDGAVASSTHADIVIPDDHDVVLISAPMTRAGRGPLRARARRQLDTEVRNLRAAGSRTLVLVPDAESLAAADGFPRRRPAAGADIVEAARRQTVAMFASLGR